MTKTAEEESSDQHHLYDLLQKKLVWKDHISFP